MIGFLAGWVARLSGPVLVYILLGLVAANALTGYLLKKAWEDNARANLECENQALRDANEANAAVTAELQRLQAEFDTYRAAVVEATAEAEKEIETQRRAMELAHEEELAALEVATNEIPDEDFFCASEPVSADLLKRMRIAVTAYHENRIGDGN